MEMKGRLLIPCFLGDVACNVLHKEQSKFMISHPDGWHFPEVQLFLRE